MCHCIWFASILLNIFSSMFIMDIGLKFSFLVVSLPGFGIRMMLVSENELGRIPSFCIVWNSFRRNGNSSSLYLWQNQAMTLSGPGHFLVRRLLITASTSELIIGLFRDLTSSWLSLGRVYLSRNLFISSRFSSLFAQGYLQYSLMVVCITVGSVLIPLYHFYCVYFILLSFLPDWSDQQSILLIFSKNQLLDSLIFFEGFFVSLSPSVLL